MLSRRASLQARARPVGRLEALGRRGPTRTALPPCVGRPAPSAHPQLRIGGRRRDTAAARAGASRSGTISPVCSCSTTLPIPPAAVAISCRARRQRLEDDIRQAVDVAAVVAHRRDDHDVGSRQVRRRLHPGTGCRGSAPARPRRPRAPDPAARPAGRRRPRSPGWAAAASGRSPMRRSGARTLSCAPAGRPQNASSAPAGHAEPCPHAPRVRPVAAGSAPCRRRTGRPPASPDRLPGAMARCARSALHAVTHRRARTPAAPRAPRAPSVSAT